ncbi:hypothetical protein SDC9_73704 [bioreactor metagenome]|uniref:ABC transmembrane type-1 domain-containing protein n=1 Tax=bioreactor metagenome TaxID=1076179 RepID=A0A644YM64_9ZZZZ
MWGKPAVIKRFVYSSGLGTRVWVTCRGLLTLQVLHSVVETGKTVIYIVRGTPLLMVVFWAYFFLPSVTGVKTDQFWTMLIALVVFDAAYLAEIVRAGILGLPKGQMECARSLGLPYMKAMRSVILPQALRNSLPSLVNQFISTIKETSLGYIIGLAEVTFIATQINSLVFTKPAEVFGILGFTYFVLCFGLSRVAFWIERRLERKGLGNRPQAKVAA